MENLHQSKSDFAKSKGYISVAVGMSKIKNFNHKYNQWLLQQIIDEPNNIKKYNKLLHRNGSPTVVRLDDINDNYYLFSNGKIWSTHFGGKFLKPYEYQKYKGENYVSHWAYKIRPNKYQSDGPKILYISRLLMFYFGNHDYKNFDDMPEIVFKNNNNKDWRVANVEFSTKADIIKNKVHKTIDNGANSKIKDTIININNIKQLLTDGKTLKFIAEKYDVSDMSVHRFIKRNNLRDAGTK